MILLIVVQKIYLQPPAEYPQNANFAMKSGFCQHGLRFQSNLTKTYLTSYVPTWIKVDPGLTSLGSTKLLIKSENKI